MRDQDKTTEPAVSSVRPEGDVAIVVLTYNRMHLLRQCVDNVLLRTSPNTREIVIWNNASEDGTSEYLETITDPRFRVVHHEANIGINGYARAFSMTSSPYLIELDDDIIEAPAHWDLTLLDAFRRLPRVGFLAANLVNNPHDQTAWVMYTANASAYRTVEENGVSLKIGPTGGGCSITSRELHDRVGGFRQSKKQIFWLEDEAYIHDIGKLGFGAAYLEDLRVLHAGGAYYAPVTREKEKYWEDFSRKQARKRRIKRMLLRIPFVRPLNERCGWFSAPDDS